MVLHPADNGFPADEPALRPATTSSDHRPSGPGRGRALSDSEVAARLISEFEGTHAPEMVSRCVSAARKGAEAVMGSGTPDLIERVARKHLQVLAIVAAERRGQMTLRPAP